MWMDTVDSASATLIESKGRDRNEFHPKFTERKIELTHKFFIGKLDIRKNKRINNTNRKIVQTWMQMWMNRLKKWSWMIDQLIRSNRAIEKMIERIEHYEILTSFEYGWKNMECNKLFQNETDWLAGFPLIILIRLWSRFTFSTFDGIPSQSISIKRFDEIFKYLELIQVHLHHWYKVYLSAFNEEGEMKMEESRLKERSKRRRDEHPINDWLPISRIELWESERDDNWELSENSNWEICKWEHGNIMEGNRFDYLLQSIIR